MAKTYEMTLPNRMFNGLLKRTLKVGVGPPQITLMATQGRRSGKIHVTPMTPIEMEGARWLVSPYGIRDWVKNVRANPRVQLMRGGKREDLEVEEVHGSQAARVLKQYVNDLTITQPYVDAAPDAPVEAFEKIVDRHPVFRLIDPRFAR